jgi:hypothetical protein
MLWAAAPEWAVDEGGPQCQPPATPAGKLGTRRPEGDRYLRVYLAQPRRKLERDPAHPEHLIAAAGIGYLFRD